MMVFIQIKFRIQVIQCKNILYFNKIGKNILLQKQIFLFQVDLIKIILKVQLLRKKALIRKKKKKQMKNMKK